MVFFMKAHSFMLGSNRVRLLMVGEKFFFGCANLEEFLLYIFPVLACLFLAPTPQLHVMPNYRNRITIQPGVLY